MEVDKGVCMSLVSEKKFRRLFPTKLIKHSHTQLTTYSGHPIKAIGEVNVDVTYRSQQAKFPLIIVAGSGPSLLGRNWLNAIRLDWKSISMVSCQSPLKELLDVWSVEMRSRVLELIRIESQ